MVTQALNQDHPAQPESGWLLSIIVGSALILIFAAILTIATLPLNPPGMGLAFHKSGDSTSALSSLALTDARFVSNTRIEGLIAIFVPGVKTLKELQKSGFVFVANAEAGCLKWTKRFALIQEYNPMVKRV